MSRYSKLTGWAAAALAAALALPVASQQNIEKLKQMKVATADLNIPVVPQGGRNADAIKANLKRIKLPPGFSIDLFQHRPLRGGTRRAPHGRRAQHQHAVCGHAQNHCLGRHQPQQG